MGLEDANWSLIPLHMQEEVREYIENARPVSGFLEAVLSNDLRSAVDRGDCENQQALAGYVIFFYNYAPCGCWGSRDNYESWRGTKNLKDDQEIADG